MSKFAVNEHVVLANDMPDPAVADGSKTPRYPKRGDKGVIVSQYAAVSESGEQSYYVRITPWLDPFVVGESNLLTPTEYKLELEAGRSDPRNYTWPDQYRIDPFSGRPYTTEPESRDGD